MTARVEQHTATAHVHGLALSALVWCTVVTCDHGGCGALYAHDGHDEGAATAAARERGWTHDGGERDGCQAHPVAGGVTAPDAARERGR